MCSRLCTFFIVKQVGHTSRLLACLLHVKTPELDVHYALFVMSLILCALHLVRYPQPPELVLRGSSVDIQ